MNESFERVHFDGEENITPRLYRRTYLVGGKPRSRFSIVFTDWQGIRRKVAAGKDFNVAIKNSMSSTRKTTMKLISRSRSKSAKPAE